MNLPGRPLVPQAAHIRPPEISVDPSLLIKPSRFAKLGLRHDAPKATLHFCDASVLVGFGFIECLQGLMLLRAETVQLGHCRNPIQPKHSKIIA